MGKLKLTKYEELLFAIIDNVVQKIVSSIELYCSKYAYPSAYFLAVISEEELAKLILLPLARELGEIKELISSRDSLYFKHGLKQKIFTSYGLQNRSAEDIEKIKQKCLYVGMDDNLKPIYARISPKETYLEIKYSTRLLTDFVHKILSTKEFSQDFKRVVIFLLKILRAHGKNKLPRLLKDIANEADKAFLELKKDPKRAEERFHKELFSNPYILIDIFKALFKKDYKKHLRNMKKLSFHDMVQYLGKYL